LSKVLCRQFDVKVLFGCIPVSFSFKEGGEALPFEFSQVFDEIKIQKVIVSALKKALSENRALKSSS